MTTATQRARTTHRTLADQRLSDLTFAAAVGGLAATIGFGWLAAITYAGVGSSPVGQDTLTIPGTQSGSNSSPSTTNGGSTTTRLPANSYGQHRGGRLDKRRLPVIRTRARLYGLVVDVLEQADWRALGTNAHLLVLDGDLAAARTHPWATE
jgi:hypothetical protein